MPLANIHLAEYGATASSYWITGWRAHCGMNGGPAGGMAQAWVFATAIIAVRDVVAGEGRGSQRGLRTAVTETQVRDIQEYD